MDRNLALELVRVTEAAALVSSQFMGRGDKNGADGAAVEAMRRAFESVKIKGEVVIGEGEILSLIHISFSIMGVGQMAVLGVSFRTVLATTFILISAIIGGASVGSSCGVIVGLAFIINNACLLYTSSIKSC